MKQYINIPNELRKLNRWVCWAMEERNGKPTKVPKNPKTAGNAMPDNADTWGSFKQAIDTAKRHNFPGIGFMFNGDGIVGVDIDGCRDKETGELTEIAADIVNTLDSYTEVSASGKGIHIICRGKLPEEKRRHKSVEMYETLRYFIMTGEVLDGRETIQERSEQLLIVHEKYINVQKKPKSVSKKPDIVLNLDDDEIIDKAMAAKNGDLFTDLMNGNWKHRYQSQSEADIALCNLLAFWTGKDADKMNRIFCRSGLYRGKWDEARPGGSYGSITIQNSIANCDKVYTPKTEKSKRKKKEHTPEVENIPADDDESFDHLVKEYEADVKLPHWIYGPYNDMWNSQRFIEAFGDNLRYNTSKGCWCIWNGKNWAEDRIGAIRQLADEAIMKLYDYKAQMERLDPEDKRIKLFLEWLRNSRNTGRKDNMIKETQTAYSIAALPEMFDSDQWLINVNNGTIDLRTGKLREHKRQDMITRICPVDYDENAKAPVFENFLKQIFSDNTELIKFIQRAMGYSLTGSTREQSLFVCYGTGANGKSTLIGVMQEIMGEYARNTNFSTFAVRNDTNTNDIARLVGTRFVTAMEVGEDKRLNEALVKQLTGGDKISARFLHKEFFDFVPTFKIWMGVNHKPKIKETDNGIWRRIKLVPFEVTIPPKDRDPELLNKLRAEMPGILAWAVKGCLEWLKNGLNPPEEIHEATNAYRGEMDTMQVFLEDCIAAKSGGTVKTGELYQVYVLWCEKNGERYVSNTKFGTKMKERGYKKGRTMVMRYYEDIILTDYANKLKYGVSDKGKNFADDYVQEGFTIVENEENPFEAG